MNNFCKIFRSKLIENKGALICCFISLASGAVMLPFSNNSKILSTINAIEKSLTAFVTIYLFCLSIKNELIELYSTKQGLNIISDISKRIKKIINLCILAVEEIVNEKSKEKANEIAIESPDEKENKITNEIANEGTGEKTNEIIIKEEVEKVIAKALEKLNTMTNEVKDEKPCQVLALIKEGEQTIVDLINNIFFIINSKKGKTFN